MGARNVLIFGRSVGHSEININRIKEFIQINPLCLAAICPAFAQMDFEDPQEDFKILTEYSIQDLEQIVKFCHGEAIPQEPVNIPNVFQVSFNILL